MHAHRTCATDKQVPTTCAAPTRVSLSQRAPRQSPCRLRAQTLYLCSKPDQILAQGHHLFMQPTVQVWADIYATLEDTACVTGTSATSLLL